MSCVLPGTKHLNVLTLLLSIPLLTPCSLLLALLPRYSREPGRKGTSALHDDHPADQPAGAAPGRPRRAEEAGGLSDGEAEATNGAGAPAAGAGESFPVFGKPVALIPRPRSAFRLF